MEVSDHIREVHQRVWNGSPGLHLTLNTWCKGKATFTEWTSQFRGGKRALSPYGGPQRMEKLLLFMKGMLGVEGKIVL